MWLRGLFSTGQASFTPAQRLEFYRGLHRTVRIARLNPHSDRSLHGSVNHEAILRLFENPKPRARRRDYREAGRRWRINEQLDNGGARHICRARISRYKQAGPYD